MCGIVGALSIGESSFRVDSDYLCALRDELTHRGPDDKGVFVAEAGRVGLGHRRLSIIDPAPNAAQPMTSAGGGVTVVFNGEIYNHAALRQELIAAGITKWRTDHSDSEVLANAFEHWGLAAIDRLIGMFAIAIWNHKERSLTLIRDRLGVKPLYFFQGRDRLLFASEIKAIIKDPSIERRVDEESLFHYLSFLATPAPKTLFKGIHKLAAGEMAQVNKAGNLTVRRYWDPLDSASLGSVSEDEAVSMIRSILEESVANRAVSDVPVGVFLSGGVDSSANLALFSRQQSSAVKTFNINYQGSDVSYPDESPYARQMAEFAGSEHYERSLGEADLVNFMDKMAWYQDEPLADPVCFPVYEVSKLARDKGVTVCQVGEGADELFWGYATWKKMFHLQRMANWPVPKCVKSTLMFYMSMRKRDHALPFELLRRDIAGQPIFWGGAEGFTHPAKMKVLSPRLRAEFAYTTSWNAIEPIRTRFLDKAKDPSTLNWMTYLDLNLRLPELLLMRVDKMSMANSLEARVPFLDHRLVELALALPQSLKTTDNVEKYLLKKAVRGLIPDSIIDRKKQGFGVPVQDWLDGPLANSVKQAIDQCLDGSDLFDAQEVLKLLGKKSSREVWLLTNFALWWQTFIAESR